MKQYTGTKVVNAEPMTRQEYNDLRGWQVPDDENPSDDGFLIEDLDGSAPNTATHTGYVSWTPKDMFEKTYLPSEHPIDRMAIENLQLLDRLKALDSLLEKPQPKFISDKQWDLLQSQRAYMKGYFKVLDDRIEDMAAQAGV